MPSLVSWHFLMNTSKSTRNSQRTLGVTTVQGGQMGMMNKQVPTSFNQMSSALKEEFFTAIIISLKTFDIGVSH